MRKSKVLSVAMSSVLVASVAAAAAMSVSAAEITKSADIPEHSVGATGGFNGWAEDVALTDADGDGVYEGLVEVAEVTDEMITGWSVDDNDTGEKYLQFKIRLDGEWTDSWGNYEPLHDRTWNSQSNVPVKEAVVGQPISFKVFFDIKNPDPAALANPDSYAEEGDDDFNYLHVWYEVVKSEEPSKEEPSKEEPSKEEESSTVEESSTTTTGTTSTVASETSTDSTAPATGDATSAAALAAVVLASLGTAVVMTKKASAK